MSIRIQDPSWPRSEYLLECILEGCRGASQGAALFAFATAGGVRLLLEDVSFERFLSDADFDLVVGVDRVTNGVALDCLAACARKNRRLTVRVFLNPDVSSLFHPKACWFRHPSHGIWVTGSGNLTPGGLRGNCEAFAVEKPGEAAQQALQDRWSEWLAFHSDSLLPLDNPSVRERAQQNTGREQCGLRTRRRVLMEDDAGKVTAGTSQALSDAVLIAEIPRGGKRWHQANFDLDTFRGFFGAEPGRTQRFLFTHVDTEGKRGDIEVRPSVSVKSHNYRFELNAGRGLPYPSEGRPIGVFLRVANRTFRYRLVLPGTLGHGEVSRYLDSHSPPYAGQLQRLATTAGAVKGKGFFRLLAGRA